MVCSKPGCNQKLLKQQCLVSEKILEVKRFDSNLLGIIRTDVKTKIRDVYKVTVLHKVPSRIYLSDDKNNFLVKQIP